MQNFDVQHNVACKPSAIGRVANVFCYVVLCFQRFVQHLDQTLEKPVKALRNVVHPLLYNFVKHFQRFCNGTNNITNEFLVSKETVVLRRWERSKQKFGFIKRVDKG